MNDYMKIKEALYNEEKLLHQDLIDVFEQLDVHQCCVIAYLISKK